MKMENLCINEKNEAYVQSCFEMAKLYSSNPTINETKDCGSTLEFSVPVRGTLLISDALKYMLTWEQDQRVPL